MTIKWTYGYTLGTLYQHSAKLTERLVISPFFVLERETGRCLWEQPESLDRNAMLYPRALSDGAIVAQKYERISGRAEFSGLYRFDAMTGAALAPSSATRSPAPQPGIVARAIARLRRAHQSPPVNEVSEDGRPDRSGVMKLDANAASLPISEIGVLFPGRPSDQLASHSGIERFRSSWPLRFYMREGAKILWQYEDVNSEKAGLTGSLTYDQILPPFAYFLLYRMKGSDESPSGGGFVHDLALRRLDLRIGKVKDEIAIAEGPIHKWPSVVDVDDQGLIVLHRNAALKRSTLVYLSFL